MFTPGTRITFQLGTGGALYTDRTERTGVVTDIDPTGSAPYYVLADDGHKFLLTPAQIVAEATERCPGCEDDNECEGHR